jgi:hypothetical protein
MMYDFVLAGSDLRVIGDFTTGKKVDGRNTTESPNDRCRSST